MRNKQTGVIEKWFGTCTDIHEAVESRFQAKRLVRELPLFITLISISDVYSANKCYP